MGYCCEHLKCTPQESHITTSGQMTPRSIFNHSKHPEDGRRSIWDKAAMAYLSSTWPAVLVILLDWAIRRILFIQPWIVTPAWRSLSHFHLSGHKSMKVIRPLENTCLSARRGKKIQQMCLIWDEKSGDNVRYSFNFDPGHGERGFPSSPSSTETKWKWGAPSCFLCQLSHWDSWSPMATRWVAQYKAVLDFTSYLRYVFSAFVPLRLLASALSCTDWKWRSLFRRCIAKRVGRGVGYPCTGGLHWGHLAPVREGGRERENESGVGHASRFP